MSCERPAAAAAAPTERIAVPGAKLDQQAAAPAERIAVPGEKVDEQAQQRARQEEARRNGVLGSSTLMKSGSFASLTEAPVGAAPSVPAATVPTATVAVGPDSSYSVDIAPMTATAGTEASSTITVHPGKGYKVNLEYPVKLTLDAATDVSFAKSVMEKPDATTFDLKSLVFAAKATAAKPGTYSLKGTLKFAVCTESTCDPKKVPVVIALNAK
jgi:hypothetical protein